MDYIIVGVIWWSLIILILKWAKGSLRGGD